MSKKPLVSSDIPENNSGFKWADISSDKSLLHISLCRSELFEKSGERDLRHWLSRAPKFKNTNPNQLHYSDIGVWFVFKEYFAWNSPLLSN